MTPRKVMMIVAGAFRYLRPHGALSSSPMARAARYRARSWTGSACERGGSAARSAICHRQACTGSAGRDLARATVQKRTSFLVVPSFRPRCSRASLAAMAYLLSVNRAIRDVQDDGQTPLL
jgi:hypothetical protein